MTIYADYTTLQDVRGYYLGAQQTTDDTLLAQLIRDTSREIESLSNRWFYPRIETRTYAGAPGTKSLVFDADLLSLTTLTNGTSGSVAAAEYMLLPANYTPKQSLVLRQSSGLTWETDSAGDWCDNISLAGVWGYSTDYPGQWQDTGAVLSGSASAADETINASAQLYAGELIKLGSEYLYVSTSGSSAAGVVRGVNGSTAAGHTQSISIYQWDFGPIGEICRAAVAAYYRLRQNPVGETVQIDGLTFSTPKAVKSWMSRELNALAACRKWSFL